MLAAILGRSCWQSEMLSKRSQSKCLLLGQRTNVRCDLLGAFQADIDQVKDRQQVERVDALYYICTSLWRLATGTRPNHIPVCKLRLSKAASNLHETGVIDPAALCTSSMLTRRLSFAVMLS